MRFNASDDECDNVGRRSRAFNMKRWKLRRITPVALLTTLVVGNAAGVGVYWLLTRRSALPACAEHGGVPSRGCIHHVTTATGPDS